MEEKKSFVENSQVAIKGTINGIIGNIVYELILTLFLFVIISVFVAMNHQGATAEELNELTIDIFNSHSLGMILSCLTSVVMIVGFVYLLKWEKIKQLIKNSWNSKTLKYGFIGFLCIIGFSIIYNNAISYIFNLGDTGNSNQENVIIMIKRNIFLGFLAVVLLAPIVEELTYRYCLFGGIYKKNKKLAYFIASFVFMFMHSVSSFLTYGFTKELLTEFLYLPPYLFSGVALCYVYDKSDSLGSSALAHILNNFISFLVVVLL